MKFGTQKQNDAKNQSLEQVQEIQQQETQTQTGEISSCIMQHDQTTGDVVFDFQTAVEKLTQNYSLEELQELAMYMGLSKTGTKIKLATSIARYLPLNKRNLLKRLTGLTQNTGTSTPSSVVFYRDTFNAVDILDHYISNIRMKIHVNEPNGVLFIWLIELCMQTAHAIATESCLEQNVKIPWCSGKNKSIMKFVRWFCDGLMKEEYNLSQ